ncbi:MAG: glycine oxidase ThiO [Gammaproteobacteria bacterium]|nr:glycine oxidase ThiO [Gammaproteobacteria bacterium]
MTKQAIVVGGGAIGMMQARELALSGWQVQLVERGLCGREASWAGGGIISPLYPWRYAEPVTALARWSQGYYGNLVESLEAESGIDAELTRHGLLMLDVDDQAVALNWSGAPNWLERIDTDALYRLEPQLAAGYEGGLWMAQVASIRNPRLLRALRTSLERLPQVRILEGCRVDALITQGERVTGVQTSDGDFHADAVIVTAGAWSAGLLDPLDIRLPVVPVKGQMMIYRAEPGTVRRVVMQAGRYVIPRRDGRVLAGSTLEFSGFDKTTTSEARETLAQTAESLYPILAKCPVEQQWAGLRPGAPEGIPFIGAVASAPGLYLNTGQFRNGLVLAPASVRLLTSLLNDETCPVDPQPYEPERRLNQATAEAGWW